MPTDMIVFGEDWGRHPSSTQHIMRRMAGDRRIIWVNSLGLRRPRLARRDLLRLAEKAASLLSRRGKQPTGNSDKLQETHPFAQLLNPQALPWPGSRLAAAFNRKSLSRQIGAAMRQYGFERPILWTSLPTALPVVGELGECAVVYYAGDDFGALAGVDHKPVLEAERQLAKKADLILAASHEIASRFDPAKTCVVAHGVDYDLFAEPKPRAPDMPDGKVAGFYGSLNGWIDINAIAEAARQLPDWTLVLIGNVETDIMPLHSLPNVMLRPAMPHRDLAQWSQHWDVSLLPFLKNRQIDASNPLKLREYLAAGRPVAATYRFKAIDDLQAPVATPAPGAGLANAILAATSMEEEVCEFRQHLAGETWEARAETVSKLIDAIRKGSPSGT
ncbi:MAG: hypothetical protein R3D34_19040 [Nitratireductor sp.]